MHSWTVPNLADGTLSERAFLFAVLEHTAQQMHGTCMI